jgi:hypothetical protein
MYGQLADDNDFAWSVSSNSCFWMGGLVYLVLAVWSIVMTEDSENPAVYAILEILAPVIYLINSGIDFVWAQRTRERNKRKRIRRVLLAKQRSDNTSESDLTRKFHKFRKQAAHRRGLIAAFFFTLAAFLALAAALVGQYGDESDADLVSFLNVLSIHCYLISAVFALSGKRTRPRGCSLNLYNADDLENLGDLLFMVGSFVDVMICDAPFANSQQWWQVFSSLLWFIDASLYLRGDYVLAMTTSRRDAARDSSTESNLYIEMPSPIHM